MTSVMIQDGIFVHQDCLLTFNKEPEKYGGKAIKKTEAQIKAESEHRERFQKDIEKREELQQKIEDKSVYVKGFSMPFGEMVEFMVKWGNSIDTCIYHPVHYLWNLISNLWVNIFLKENTPSLTINRSRKE